MAQSAFYMKYNLKIKSINRRNIEQELESQWLSTLSLVNMNWRISLLWLTFELQSFKEAKK